MRQYGHRHQGSGFRAPDMSAKDAGQPPIGGSMGNTGGGFVGGPVPLLTDPGLAALARLIEDNTRALRELTELLARRETVEATATIGGEVIRLEVRA